jgi:hypothetical protein
LALLCAAFMAIAAAAQSEQCIFQKNGYSVCLIGASYQYSGPMAPFGSFGSCGVFPWPWTVSIGQSEGRNMADELLAIYQAEGGLVQHKIVPVGDSAVMGSGLFLRESKGVQETSVTYDYLIDLGNDRSCWLSSSSEDVMLDMAKSVRIVTPWS